MAGVRAARVPIRALAPHQHRRKQHGRFHHGHRPPLVFAPINARGRLRVRSAGGAILHALGLYPPPCGEAQSAAEAGGVGGGGGAGGGAAHPPPPPPPPPRPPRPCPARASLK